MLVCRQLEFTHIFYPKKTTKRSNVNSEMV